MTNLNIVLTLDEVNGVLTALGQLPTLSGAYPLLVKIKEQADAQLATPPAPDANTEVQSTAEIV